MTLMQLNLRKLIMQSIDMKFKIYFDYSDHKMICLSRYFKTGKIKLKNKQNIQCMVVIKRNGKRVKNIYFPNNIQKVLQYY